MKPLKIDLAAFVAQQMAEVEAQAGPRFAPLPEGAFPAPSLSAWLGWARAADVPSVPAEEVARFAVDELLGFETDSPATQAMLERLSALNRTLPPDTMLRWDCCAPMGIKWHLGDGHPECPTDTTTRELHPGDPRAFDILYEFPADDVAVFRRPWVTAAVHDRFPVEFRVFVHEGRVVAVSNYYVQRALPEAPQVLAQARGAANAAARMIDAMRHAGGFPWVGSPRDLPETVQRGIEATLDFLVTPGGEVLFLEAGPGFGLGAHPCCFHNPDTRTVDRPDGIRLAVGGPSLPLIG